MIEWKYTNGLWRVAYMSEAVADWVLSGPLIAGCAQTAVSRVGSEPIPWL